MISDSITNTSCNNRRIMVTSSSSLSSSSSTSSPETSPSRRRSTTTSVKRGSSVSFSEYVVLHEVPPLSPYRKRAMFYDRDDFYRFQVQEINRRDQEATDHLLDIIDHQERSSSTLSAPPRTPYSPFVI